MLPKLAVVLRYEGLETCKFVNERRLEQRAEFKCSPTFEIEIAPRALLFLYVFDLVEHPVAPGAPFLFL